RRGRGLLDAGDLRTAPGGYDVHRLGRRLGRRTHLHRLRTAAGGSHLGALRGQTRGHPGRRRLLPRHRAARGQRPLHRPDGHARRAQGGSGRRADEEVRPVQPAGGVPRRRAARSGHVRMDEADAGRGDRTRHPRDRQLVADRDRVADRGEPARPDQVPPQARLPHQTGARLSGGDPRPESCFMLEKGYWRNREMRKHVAMIDGLESPTLVLKNATYLNMYTKQWLQTHIWIYNDRIVYVGNELTHKQENIEFIDCQGKYLVPGYIEPHAHPFQLYNPEQFALHAAQFGTTTLINDNLMLLLLLDKKKAFSLLQAFSHFPVSMYWWARYDSQS